MNTFLAVLKGLGKGIFLAILFIYLSWKIYYFNLPLVEQRQYDMSLDFELFDFMNYKVGEAESITVISYIRGWFSSYCYIGIVDGVYTDTDWPDLVLFGDRDAINLGHRPMISFTFDNVIWVEVIESKVIIHSSQQPVIHDQLSPKYEVIIVPIEVSDRHNSGMIGCPKPQLHPHSLLHES